MNLLTFRTLSQEFRSWFQPESVVRHLCRHRSKELSSACSQADELLLQTFTFQDPWDMEPCSHPYALVPMQWDQSPNGDPEWVYMLNRHDYLYKLLLAYEASSNPRYILKLKWYLLHWIEQNPVSPKDVTTTETTRTIDTGIRCMNWLFLLLHMASLSLPDKSLLLSDAELTLLLESLANQLFSLRERDIPKYALSNWGVLQTTAICACCPFLAKIAGHAEDTSFQELGAWAEKQLKLQLELQIHQDGSHWEQSIMYHVEVLLAIIKLVTARNFFQKQSAESGDDLHWLTSYLSPMSLYVMHNAGPDHCQLPQCDSDVTDIRDVMVKAAILTRNGVFKFNGFSQIDLDSAWLFGKEGITAYDSLVPCQPDSLYFHARDTGNVFFRSSWEPDASFTSLQCGPLGSGHGHGDLTHISLSYGGKPFLIDSGRYSYREDEPLRTRLKDPQAHNVCVVDGHSMAKADTSWTFASYGQPFKTYYTTQDNVHYCEMAYHCLLNDGTPCLVIRKVISVCPGIWMITDEILCHGAHTAEEFYHLDPEITALLQSPHQWQLTREDLTLTVTSFAPLKKEPCLVSRKYNQLSDTSCLSAAHTFTDHLVTWNCFSAFGSCRQVPVFLCSGAPADDSGVTALEFPVSAEESWTLLIWHQETFRGNKLYQCQGVPIYAKAAAIHRKNGQFSAIRLRS